MEDWYFEIYLDSDYHPHSGALGSSMEVQSEGESELLVKTAHLDLDLKGELSIPASLLRSTLQGSTEAKTAQ